MAAEATASTELLTMAEITPSALMETTMVNTEDYNTLIECLKSDIPLTTTQVTLLESVTQQLMKRNYNVERRLSMTQNVPKTELSSTTVDPLFLGITGRPSATTKTSVFGLGLLVALKDYDVETWAGVLKPETVFPGLSNHHFSYTVTELDCYSKKIELLQDWKPTMPSNNQVDYPTWVVLPLEEALKLKTDYELPTVYFERKLANLWTDLRSALLCAALQLWKTDESSPYVTHSESPLVAVGIYLSRTRVTGMKQFNRLYYSHSFVNSPGDPTIDFEETEMKSALYLKLDFSLKTFADGLARELNGTAYYNGHKRFLVGHLPLTEMQMFRSQMITAMHELKNYKWTVLYGKTEDVITETEKTNDDLKVNLKVTELSLGSTDTVITLQRY